MRETVCLALAALCFAGVAKAKENVPPPPPPTVEPDWTAVRSKGEAILKAMLFDPGSAQIAWTEGFRWGYLKPIIGKKVYQWVGCGQINAKNRMGGYVGAKPFYVAVRLDGTVSAESEPLLMASCNVYGEPHVDPQPELLDLAGERKTLSVADELSKLAVLRDKGIITPAEFEQQKAKLLSN